MKRTRMNAAGLTILLVLSACLLAPGCAGTMYGPSASVAASPPTPAPVPGPAQAPAKGSADYLGKTVIRNDEGGGAVENVVLLNQKLAYTQERVATLQGDNQKLAAQTAKQADELQRLRTDLAMAQKELADANVLLKEMRQSLDKWKSDVLGYRDEMRSAQKAQIDAMAKILTLLTGDVPSAPVPAGPAPAKGDAHASSK